jgi:hypothetical protein
MNFTAPIFGKRLLQCRPHTNGDEKAADVKGRIEGKNPERIMALAKRAFNFVLFDRAGFLAFSLLVAVSALAACEPRSPNKPAAPTIENWGPRKSVQGKGFNVRPNGESAMWIKAAGLPDAHSYKVKIGDFEAQPAKRIPGGLAAAVPAPLLQSTGSHKVVLLEDHPNSAEIYVGMFEVRPAE